MIAGIRFGVVAGMVLVFVSVGCRQEEPAAKPAPANPATRAEGRRISIKQREQTLIEA